MNRTLFAILEAKEAQMQVARGTKVTISLDLLEVMISELERLSRVDNVQAVVMKHKDIRA